MLFQIQFCLFLKHAGTAGAAFRYIQCFRKMVKHFSGKKNETFIQKDVPKINVLQQKMEVKKMSKLVFQLQTPMGNTSTF